MNAIPHLFALSGIVLLACISPGPDFIAVSSHALGNRKTGILVALGITTGCVIWAGMAMFGLGLLMRQLGQLYTVMQILGALYLLFLGSKILFSAGHSAASPSEANPSAAETFIPPALAFRHGLLVNLANPKAAVFFSSLFVTMLPANPPPWLYGITLTLVGLVSCSWFILLALLFSEDRVQRCYTHLKRPITLLMEAALIRLGTKLLVDR